MSHVGQESDMLKTKTFYLIIIISVIGWIVSLHYRRTSNEYKYRYLHEIAAGDSLTAVNDSLYKKMSIPTVELDSLKKHANWLESVVDVKAEQIQNLTQTVIHYKLLYMSGKAALDSVSSQTNIRYYYFQKMYGMTTVEGRFTSAGDYTIGIKRKPLILKYAFVKSDSGITVYTSVNDTTLKIVEQNSFYPYHIQSGPKYGFGYMAGVIIGPHPNIYVGLFGRRGKSIVGIGVGNGILIFQYMKGF